MGDAREVQEVFGGDVEMGVKEMFEGWRVSSHVRRSAVHRTCPLPPSSIPGHSLRVCPVCLQMWHVCRALRLSFCCWRRSASCSFFFSLRSAIGWRCGYGCEAVSTTRSNYEIHYRL